MNGSRNLGLGDPFCGVCDRAKSKVHICSGRRGCFNRSRREAAVFADDVRLVEQLRSVNSEQAPYANDLVLGWCHHAADVIEHLMAITEAFRDHDDEGDRRPSSNEAIYPSSTARITSGIDAQREIDRLNDRIRQLQFSLKTVLDNRKASQTRLAEAVQCAAVSAIMDSNPGWIERLLFSLDSELMRAVVRVHKMDLQSLIRDVNQSFPEVFSIETVVVEPVFLKSGDVFDLRFITYFGEDVTDDQIPEVDPYVAGLLAVVTNVEVEWGKPEQVHVFAKPLRQDGSYDPEVATLHFWQSKNHPRVNFSPVIRRLTPMVSF
jgi:hypothetical protein